MSSSSIDFGFSIAEIEKPKICSDPIRNLGSRNIPNTKQRGSQTGKPTTKDLQHVPCKFFRTGSCTAGKNCLFSHNLNPPSEKTICKYFLKGNCKFGARCALAHLLEDSKDSFKNDGQIYHSKTHPVYPRKQDQPLNIKDSIGFLDVRKKSINDSNCTGDNNSIIKAGGGTNFFLSCSAPNLSISSPPSFQKQNVGREFNSQFEALKKYDFGQQPSHRVDSFSLSDIDNRRKTSRLSSIFSRIPISDSINSNDSAFKVHLFENRIETTDESFYFAEDFIPSSLEELLTFEERNRKMHRAAMAESLPASFTSSSSNAAKYGYNQKISSPSIFSRKRIEPDANLRKLGTLPNYALGSSPMDLSIASNGNKTSSIRHQYVEGQGQKEDSQSQSVTILEEDEIQFPMDDESLL